MGTPVQHAEPRPLHLRRSPRGGPFSSPRSPVADVDRLAAVMRAVETDLGRAKREKQLSQRIEAMDEYIAKLENANRLLEDRLEGGSLWEDEPEEKGHMDGDGQDSDQAQAPLQPEEEGEGAFCAERYERHSRAQLLEEIQALSLQVADRSEAERLEREKEALQGDESAEEVEELRDELGQLRVMNRELLRQVRALGGGALHLFSSPQKCGSRGQAVEAAEEPQSLKMQGQLARSQEEVERLQRLCSQQRKELDGGFEQVAALEAGVARLSGMLAVVEAGDVRELRAFYEAAIEKQIEAHREKFESCARELLNAQNECLAIKAENMRLKRSHKSQVTELQEDLTRLRKVLKAQINEDIERESRKSSFSAENLLTENHPLASRISSEIF